MRKLPRHGCEGKSALPSTDRTVRMHARSCADNSANPSSNSVKHLKGVARHLGHPKRMVDVHPFEGACNETTA